MPDACGAARSAGGGDGGEGFDAAPLRGDVVEPDVEKPPLGVFKVVAADDPEISPAPASQCEAPQRTGFEPDQQRDQNADACDDEG